MTNEERERLITRYAEGYDIVMAALAGITPEELDRPERPSEWSPRQVAHHLADSEMTSAVRVRRLIAEDEPTIVGYDQDGFAARLFYGRPIEPSLMAFRHARESTVPILRMLDDGQWLRGGVHSETGRTTVEEWLRYYAQHAVDHAEQITRARAAGSTDRRQRRSGASGS